MIDALTVLVVGATGNQGGATARHLLAGGHQVRALVRDPSSPAAVALAELGATLVQGDMEDPSSLRRAMRGVDGVFSVQGLADTPETLAAEVRQGINVADAAQATEVRHLVYSSVGGAERETGIDHFESKAEVERHILAQGIPATILRPVFFMENLLMFAEAEEERVVALPVKPDRPMQLIAVDDIGAFAADAFGSPETFLHRQIELAGDELTFPEIAEVFTEVTGTPTRFEGLAIEGRMLEWFAESGYQADIPALRQLRPHLMTFRDFLSAQFHTEN
ncbi:NmrA/HSCARG family protein [Spiractinospora alimapuensis]|uniref:NmrA/HSCARG family protein n=1 Tax=Spiractinospora alimapuensis TaxID=2820884 RepID=UPI001F46168E|nr:NmrA/HSCARG family protein [Spiractinospora alimapuensis]QVQ52838.1 NmrA/HSCARG family protein [Spiractinospora alimapuensis]